MKKDSISRLAAEMLEQSKMQYALSVVHMLQIHLLTHRLELKDPNTNLPVEEILEVVAKVFKVEPPNLKGGIKQKYRTMQLAFLSMVVLFHDIDVFSVAKELSFHWQTGHKAIELLKVFLGSKSPIRYHDQILMIIHDLEKKSGERLTKNIHSIWDQGEHQHKQQEKKQVTKEPEYIEMLACFDREYRSSCPLSMHMYTYCPKTAKASDYVWAFQTSHKDGFKMLPFN